MPVSLIMKPSFRGVAFKGNSAPSIPFLYDIDTHYWDFIASDNLVDTLGSSTVSRVLERTGNKVSLVQNNKALQALPVTGGLNFNSLTNRALTFDQPPTITNGKNGYYIAGVITATTGNSYIMEVSRAVGSQASRCQLYISSARNLILKLGSGESTSLVAVFTSVQLTFGLKYAIEVLLDFDADTCTVWINGVQQSLTITGAPWASFPATNPQVVTVGNSAAGSLSFDGVINNLVFCNGVPASNIRTSIGAFQQTRQAA